MQSCLSLQQQITGQPGIFASGTLWAACLIDYKFQIVVEGPELAPLRYGRGNITLVELLENALFIR